MGLGRTAFWGHNGGAPGMNGELRVYRASGYIVVAIANLDPPSATALVEFFEARLPE
jgi:D-alanyl-D-alanine carboxypeptidase